MVVQQNLLNKLPRVQSNQCLFFRHSLFRHSMAFANMADEMFAIGHGVPSNRSVSESLLATCYVYPGFVPSTMLKTV